MRIGIDCRLWNETGVGRYIRNLVSELHQLDSKNEYVLFVLSKDKETLSKQFQSKTWGLVTADIRWHSVAEQKDFPKIIEKENLDLMHFTYFSVPIKYSGKFVVTMHDVIPFVHATGRASTLPLPLYTAKKIAYKYIVKKALQNAEAVIVPTKAVGEDIKKIIRVSPQKIVVTYEGISDLGAAEPVDLGLSPHSYFFYVGNAYPHKNLENLLEGFLEFSPNHPDIKMVLAGKKDFFYQRLLESPIIRALNNSSIFVEGPTDGELKELYHDSLAFVSASKMEGFVLPALEALSQNTLVILSDIPVFKEICLDVPVAYFNYRDPKNISLAMEKVFSVSKDFRKERGMLGKKLAQSFSWKKMAEKTLHVYNSIANSE